MRKIMSDSATKTVKQVFEDFIKGDIFRLQLLLCHSDIQCDKGVFEPQYKGFRAGF